MSFDLIETTVANAILLRAAFDHDPVDLKLTLADSPQLFKDYEEKSVRPKLTLETLLKEPLGKYQFKVFLRSYNAEARIDLARDIQEYKKRKAKDRVSKSKYIFSKYLVRAVGDPESYDLLLAHHAASKSISEPDVKDEEEEETDPSAANSTATSPARDSPSKVRSKSVSAEAGKSSSSPKNPGYLSPPGRNSQTIGPAQGALLAAAAASAEVSANEDSAAEQKPDMALSIPEEDHADDNLRRGSVRARGSGNNSPRKPTNDSPREGFPNPFDKRDSEAEEKRFVSPPTPAGFAESTTNNNSLLPSEQISKESTRTLQMTPQISSENHGAQHTTITAQTSLGNATAVESKPPVVVKDDSEQKFHEDELISAKSSDFMDEKLGEEEYREENSEDEDIHKEGLLDLGIPEDNIQAAYLRWKDGIKKRRIPSDLFDDMLRILEDQLQNYDFKTFLQSLEYSTYVLLRNYCENTQIKYSDFQIFRVLGKGAFGAVHAVRKVDTKKIYAMKEMEKRKVKFYQSEKMCNTERNVLQSLSSPFALNLKYAFCNEESLFLVMDICQGGDLQYHLSEAKDNCFDENRTRFYAAELILALEHLHSLDYVYRDLKPGNVLLDESGHVMLSDLGLVHKISSKKVLNSLAGTAGYWAPEVMMRKSQTKAIDWWSFGVFLFKCLTGRRPKCSCSKKDKEWCPFGTTDDHEQFAKAGHPMKFNLDLEQEKLSQDAKDLIMKLLDPNPTRRVGAKGANELKNHAFFNSIDWDKLEHREVKPPFVPRKGEVHAATLGEIGEGDPNMAKYRKLQLTAEDEDFYRRWEYKSMTAIQEEIVWTLRRNERVKRKQRQRNERKLQDARLRRGCCSIQ